VAIADQEVGIDIESIRPAKTELVARVMNEEEQAQISQAANPDRMFTHLWTQKEAIVKWQGIGIEGMEKMYDVRCTMYDVPFTMSDVRCETIEKEKYIYTIIYGKLHCISAEI
jgi:phosphopantetheine--protein transferase-like protein